MKDTREILIEATYKELYHYGYQGTSLSKIMTTSNLTKGALYHYFKSKKEIALESISSMVGTFMKEYWEEVAEKTDTPYKTLFQRIEQLPSELINNEPLIDTKHGCFLNNLMQEMIPLDDDFANLLQGLYARFENTIFLLLQKAQAKGELKENIDVEDLAIYVTNAIEASISLAKLKNDISYYHRNTRHLKCYLDLLNK